MEETSEVPYIIKFLWHGQSLAVSVCFPLQLKYWALLWNRHFFVLFEAAAITMQG